MEPDFIATVRELKARQDIHDALMRYCRGVDRCDRALALSAYHPGAWDAHGSHNGLATEVMSWAIDMHLKHFVSTAHYISNEYIEFDGAVARVESCIEGVLRFERNGQLYDLIGRGRYLDRFERRDGDWRIVHRLVVQDSTRVDPVVETAPSDSGGNIPMGGRLHGDPSFAFFRR